MTTPGGVPNLPVGALTVDTLAAKLQDQTPRAHRGRAAGHMPGGLFDKSSGGNVLNDISPFGIITRIWSEVNSRIATADPANIQGPDDLPGLFKDFIESLPVIGQFIDILEAIQGTYTGGDSTLKAIQTIFEPIRDLFQLIAGATSGWPTRAEVIAGWKAHQAEWVSNFETLTGLNIDEGPVKFIESLSSALGLAKIAKGLQDLIDGLWAMLGNVGTGKNVADVVAALTTAWNWLYGGFQQLIDGLAAILGGIGTGKNVSDLITLFGDGWKFIQQGVAWLNTELQTVIDQIQKLVDGIAKLIGNPVAAVGNTVQAAIDAIAGILGIANAAQSSADFANIGIAAITAANKAGFSDEFNEPMAASLPAANWKAIYSGSGTGTWGPNGNGVVAWKPAGPVIVGNPRRVTYVRTANPLPGIPATITLVLSKAPHEDALVKSFFHIDGQANPTDQSCVRYWIGLDTAQFQTVDAAGAVTNVGAAVAIPQVKNGDVFELVLDASTAVLSRNGIRAASNPYTPLAGRCVGFGAQTDAYTWILGGHPAPEFAGIAFHP